MRTNVERVFYSTQTSSTEAFPYKLWSAASSPHTYVWSGEPPYLKKKEQDMQTTIKTAAIGSEFEMRAAKMAPLNIDDPDSLEAWCQMMFAQPYDFVARHITKGLINGNIDRDARGLSRSMGLFASRGTVQVVRGRDRWDDLEWIECAWLRDGSQDAVSFAQPGSSRVAAAVQIIWKVVASHELYDPVLPDVPGSTCIIPDRWTMASSVATYDINTPIGERVGAGYSFASSLHRVLRRGDYHGHASEELNDILRAISMHKYAVVPPDDGVVLCDRGLGRVSALRTDVGLAIRMEINGMISYLPHGRMPSFSGGEDVWRSKLRQEAKPARFFRRLFTDEAIEELGLTPRHFEVLANYLSSVFSVTGTPELVSGEMIRYWYHEKRYAQRGDLGTLASSCMRYSKTMPNLELYVKNPNQVSMVILCQDDRLVGRAIVWTDINGEKLYDRIYGSEIVISFLEDYCQGQGWRRAGRDDVVKLDNPWFNIYPYCDTLREITHAGELRGHQLKDDLGRLLSYNTYHARDLGEGWPHCPGCNVTYPYGTSTRLCVDCARIQVREKGLERISSADLISNAELVVEAGDQLGYRLVVNGLVYQRDAQTDEWFLV